MQNLSDYELMLLIKGKQHAALSVLYDRYAGLIYSFAWKALRDEPAARDIVQAVFLRLWTTSPVTIRARAGSPAGCSP